MNLNENIKADTTDASKYPPELVRLLELLGMEYALSLRMAECAEDLQQALVKFDSISIEKISKEQDEISKQLSSAELQRFHMIADFFSVSLPIARTMKMSELISRLPYQFADELLSVQQEISIVLAKLQFLNSVNRILALRGKNSVKSTLDFIKQERMHVIDTQL